MIIVFGGVQVDRDAEQNRFPASAVDEVAERLRTLLAHLKPRIAVGAAANGTDLLVIEGALAESVEVHVVLPFAKNVFRSTSVEDRGPEWVARYDRLMDQCRNDVVEGYEDPEDGDVYLQHNGELLDHAQSVAQEDERIWTVVVRPSGSSGTVTDDLASRATDRGQLVLDLAPVPDAKPTVFVAMPYGSKFDPVTRRTINCDDTFNRVYVPVLEDFDTHWKRADLETDSGVIHVGMIQDLATSDLVICDLSAGNVNVAYETGLRHALADKSTLLVFPTLTPSGKHQTPPFDVMPIRHVRFPRSARLTETQAEAGIRALRDYLNTALRPTEPQEVDSPVHAWFAPSGSGRLTTRSSAAALASIEQGIRSEVQAALRSSNAERMQEALLRLDETPELTESARSGLRIQLGAGLLSEGQYSEAKALLELAQPAPESPLWLLWAQQTSLAYRRLGEAAIRDGNDPEQHFSHAESLLQEALSAAGDSSETCGITAGLAKRRAIAALRSSNHIRASGHIARMVDLYRRGWVVEPDAYMGVNLLAGLRIQAQHFSGDETVLTEASSVAPVALFFAEREAIQDSSAFYPAASVADVHLNRALLLDGQEREAAINKAASAYALAVALPVAKDNLRAAVDQFEFLLMCGDDPDVIEPLADLVAAGR
ncbi:tetratricopeptide repeat-containing protein [Blastococcus sp. SYSU DS0619]